MRSTAQPQKVTVNSIISTIPGISAAIYSLLFSAESHNFAYIYSEYSGSARENFTVRQTGFHLTPEIVSAQVRSSYNTSVLYADQLPHFQRLKERFNVLRTVLSGKIHRALVTQAEPGYVGSVTVDKALLEAAGIREYERVEIANVSTGARFATYTITGEENSGVICLNGAAARLACVGDPVIIMAYAQMSDEEYATHRPKVVFVDADNTPCRITHYERHGALA